MSTRPDDPLPPHDTEAEQAVLGCVLLAPDDCVPELLESIGGDPSAFYDIRHQTLAEEILAMHTAGERIDLITVPGWLRNRGKLDDAGGRAYVASHPDMVASPAMVGTYAKTVREQYAKRMLIRHHTEGLARVNGHLGETASLIGEWQHSTDSLKTLLTGGNNPELLRFLDVRQFDLANPPELVIPAFTLAGKPLATPGNLCTISAQAKAGKSAFVGAMIASVFSDPDGADTFRIGSQNSDGKTVLHFDTEQSREDHFKLVHNALRRAGSPPPHWLKSYLLSGEKPSRCRALVRAAIEREAKEGRLIHSIIIDGVADLVSDVNKTEEGNGLVAELHGLAIANRCPIVLVIHQNPANGPGTGEKTRGHLGSQLERKSETNLKLKKAGEITTALSDKQRGAPITDDDGVRFRWDDAAGMHMSCAEGSPNVKPEKLAQYRAELEAAFEGRAGMKFGELKASLMERAKLSESSANHRITRDYPKAKLLLVVAGIYSPKK